MTQPKYAPISIDEEVRDFYKLEVPPPWMPHRPGDFDPLRVRAATGTGPDQGYLALLARRFEDRLLLRENEYLDDVLAASLSIGLARAARFGRAPVAKDLEFAFNAFDYLQPTTKAMLERRRELVGGVAHDLWHRRELVELFDAELLSLSPDAIRSHELWKNRLRLEGD